MNVKEVPIDSIVPYDNNPRNNDDAVDYVANSIERFGFKQPIVVDSNNVIIVGHTRYKAAQSLGLETVPVVCADDLSEDEAKAYRLADNKVSEWSEWDYDALEEELDDILDIDMTEFGFVDEESEEERFEEDISEKNIEDQLCIAIDCETEEQAEKIFEELSEMGYKCRLLTL